MTEVRIVDSFGERWWMERDMGLLWGAHHVMILLWV